MTARFGPVVSLWFAEVKVKRVLGWFLIVIGVWAALYPVGILLSWVGGAMIDQTFNESVGRPVGDVIRITIESLILGGLLILWGRSLVRKSKDQADPPGPAPVGP